MRCDSRRRSGQTSRLPALQVVESYEARLQDLVRHVRRVEEKVEASGSREGAQKDEAARRDELQRLAVQVRCTGTHRAIRRRCSVRRRAYSTASVNDVKKRFESPQHLANRVGQVERDLSSHPFAVVRPDGSIPGVDMDIHQLDLRVLDAKFRTWVRLGRARMWRCECRYAVCSSHA